MRPLEFCWLALSGAGMVLLPGSAQAQETVEFEAASVRLADPSATAGRFLRGGPGTGEPGFLRCTSCSLEELLLRAFGIGRYQLAGPEWLDTRIQIVATVPPGTTAEQSRLMLRNLLVQRFKIAFHWARQEKKGYALGVAKEGPRLKASVAASTPALGEGQEVNLGGNMAVRLGPGLSASGITSYTSGDTNVTNMAGRRATMEQLAQSLAGRLEEPVVDATGLTGPYDFTLTFSLRPPAPPDAGIPAASLPQPSLPEALAKLGLTLDARRVTLEVLAIDHAEKAPVENE
jgi:uncharacterized protein (TIGR03435 family)